MVVFIIIGFLIACLAVDAFIQLKKRQEVAAMGATSHAQKVFDHNVLKIPRGLYFDKTHMWAFMESNGNVKVGIDDFLQHVTGPLTSVKTKSPGEKIKKGEQLLSIIQNGKQLNIFAPISGTISKHNQEIINDSSILNSSPYQKGWVYEIEPSNWLRETQLMVMADKANELFKSEFGRLKDFFSFYYQANKLKHAHITLQDGGSFVDNILVDMGPEIWEDFQTKFIEKSI